MPASHRLSRALSSTGVAGFVGSTRGAVEVVADSEWLLRGGRSVASEVKRRATLRRRALIFGEIGVGLMVVGAAAMGFAGRAW